METVRVSSSTTLFFKVFLPTVWIVFFGALTIFILLYGGIDAFRRLLWLKVGAVIFFVTGFVLIYFTLLKLKRVELDAEHFFVTNYFKTYRYTYDSLIDIRETDMLILHLVFFELAEKGAFGKKIFFISRQKVWKRYVEEHPEKFAHLG